MRYSIETELEPGEKLLWSGAPQPGIMLRPADAFLIPFSLLWCSFAVFREWQVIQSDAPLFFILWGIPFILIGLYFVVGRFWVEAKQRENTQYMLTDRRVLISSGLFSRRLRSLPLGTLSEISVSVNERRGVGTVQLGTGSPFVLFAQGLSWPSMAQHTPPAFEFTKNAREVERQVRAAQLAVQKGAS